FRARDKTRIHARKHELHASYPRDRTPKPALTRKNKTEIFLFRASVPESFRLPARCSRALMSRWVTQHGGGGPLKGPTPPWSMLVRAWVSRAGPPRAPRPPRPRPP